MTQPTTKSFTRWKSAENGLIAHIYEHAASSYITDYLLDNGLFFIADFDHWAKTYGTVLYLDFNTHSHRASRILRKAFSEFKKSKMSSEQIKKASQQIALEYERPLMELDEQFIYQLQALHQNTWSDINELPAFQAKKETSVNTVFSMPGIRYGRKAHKNSIPLSLYFEIDMESYAGNPALKALSVLLVQAVALNLHKLLENDFIYYDMGDEWDLGAPTVAYRTVLSFPKITPPNTHELEDVINRHLLHLREGAFSLHLKQLLLTAYKAENASYFSLEAMNDITDGIIIGYAGWKSVAKVTTIQSLINNLSVEFLSADDTA